MSAATDHSASLTNTGVLAITTPGTIAAPGSGTVTNTGILVADTSTGEADIDATLHSPGIIQLRSGTLALNGGGAFVLDGSATLDFVNGPSGGSSLGFLAPGGTLAVQQAAPFGATLSGFGGTDVLDITPVSFASAVASYAAGTLTVGDGTHSAAFQLSGTYAQAGFHLAADGHGGTAIGYG